MHEHGVKLIVGNCEIKVITDNTLIEKTSHISHVAESTGTNRVDYVLRPSQAIAAVNLLWLLGSGYK